MKDRHKERMRQSERHHRERMAAQERVRYAGAGPAASSSSSSNLLFWAAVGLVCLAVGATVLGMVIVLAVALIQGLVAAAVIGGIVGAVIYFIQRRRTPHPFTFQKPDRSLGRKERAIAAYRSLDPVTRSAVKGGAIAGAAAIALGLLL